MVKVNHSLIIPFSFRCFFNKKAALAIIFSCAGKDASSPVAADSGSGSCNRFVCFVCRLGHTLPVLACDELCIWGAGLFVAFVYHIWNLNMGCAGCAGEHLVQGYPMVGITG